MAPTVIPSGGRFIAAHEKSANVAVAGKPFKSCLRASFSARLAAAVIAQKIDEHSMRLFRLARAWSQDLF